MPKRYPHLNDTAFPDLQTVKPYQRETTFDYTRYDYEVPIKLCNVPWPYDYTHVVNWTSEAMRDEYLNQLEGPTVELGSGFAHAQLDRIVVPVPYDVALTYNYVYIKVPIIAEDEAVDYETRDGIRTICAFVSDVIYNATSATTIVLDVDWWTTYLPHLSISSMMLTRGHAPMLRTDAVTFLKDPVHNCSDLLTADVDFGSSEVVRSGEVMPLSTAEPILVIASTVPYSDINGMARATSAQSSSPTYYNTGARNGEQVGVRSFVWAPNGKSYENMTNPSRATRVGADAPTGLYYYGMMGRDVTRGMLDVVFGTLPTFAVSINAAFVVPSDLVNVDRPHAIGSATLYEVATRQEYQHLGTFALSKEMFGYPERYADLAKLYTEPYAHLELSDDAGHSITVKVEDTSGQIDVAQLLNVTWPMLTWDVALMGLASTANQATYTWAAFDGTQTRRSVYNSDFARMVMSYDFPTYALYLDAQTEQAARGNARLDRARHDAIVAYQSAMRSANTAEQNAYASNATAKTNADASADTAATNVENTGEAQDTNTATSNDLRTLLTGYQNTLRSHIAEDAQSGTNNTTYSLGEQDVEFNMYSSDIALKSEAISGAMNTLGSLMSGNTTGAIATGVASLVTITTNQALNDAAIDVIDAKVGIQQDHVSLTVTETNTSASDTTREQNRATKAINDINVALANTNAGNTQRTAKANASRSKSTSDANANYSRDTTEENAKAQLENAQSDYLDDMRAFAADAPNAHGGYSGQGIHEAMRNRAVHLRAITQDASAISRAGDTFLRYGYRYDGMWNVDSWCPEGAKYCYWQTSDLIQDMTARPNVMASRTIRAMLEQGITVWSNPDEIGRW